MSNPLQSIDPNILQAVTGGITHRPANGGSGIDGLIDQLNSITGSIADINKKTSGFGSGEMLALCMLAMQHRQPANVVYVGRRGWW
jgi:hypothetical protein